MPGKATRRIGEALEERLLRVQYLDVLDAPQRLVGYPEPFLVGLDQVPSDRIETLPREGKNRSVAPTDDDRDKKGQAGIHNEQDRDDADGDDAPSQRQDDRAYHVPGDPMHFRQQVFAQFRGVPTQEITVRLVQIALQ